MLCAGDSSSFVVVVLFICTFDLAGGTRQENYEVDADELL